MMRIGDLTIRKKFFLSFALLLTLVFFGGLITYTTFSQINNFQQLKIEMAELMLDLAKVHEQQKDFLSSGWKGKDFLETGSSSDIKQINQELNAIQEELNKLAASDAVLNSSLDNDIRLLNNLVVDYDKTFRKLCRLFFKRGFKDYGLEGEMRNYAHNLQMCKSDKEKIFALTLRKHEKDFALRNDTKYVDKLHSTALDFSNLIEGASIADYPHMTTEYKTQTLAVIDAYRKHFDRIVQAEIEIGLSHNSGVLADLERQLNKTTPLIDYIYAKLNLKNEQLAQQAQITIGLTVLFLVIGSLFLIYFLRLTVSKPIIKLDKIVKAVLSGDAAADRQLDTKTKDEIGNLSRNFKLMLESLRENIQIINEKNKALEEKAMIDKDRNWSIEGLSKFSEIMKSTDLDQKSMSFAIINELVKYTNSNQGAIFIKEGDAEGNEFLSMKSGYAYSRRKYFGKRIDKGEGLIGQCWIEGEAVHLTDVPEAYINIRSGLGDAAPTSVIIVPLIHQEEVIGVIEMASFKPYGPAVIKFLKEFSNRLGASFYSVNMQQRTNDLLENSQEMAEQLKAQEEEIRQQMEELKATQESLERELSQMSDKLSLSDLQKDLFDGLIAKVYDGVIIIDSNYVISAVSSYLLTEMHYNKEDLLEESPEIILKTSLDKEIKNLSQDPLYILTAMSERKTAKIMDKYGKMDIANYVLSTITIQENRYTVVLFNKEKEEQDKKLLKRLIAPNQ